MINSKKATFVYRNNYNCLLFLDSLLQTWNELAERLQHLYLH